MARKPVGCIMQHQWWHIEFCTRSLITERGDKRFRKQRDESLFRIEGRSQADVNNRIKIGWMKWKEKSWIMCDRKVPVELKDKVFKAVIRPAMTHGSECWAVKKKDDSKLNSAEMRILRWARGKTRLGHIRNEDIRKEAHIKPVETFLENKWLKRFGHCLRREQNHICAKSLRQEASGRRRRGRPKKRWSDNIKEDTKYTNWLNTWHKIEITGWLK